MAQRSDRSRIEPTRKGFVTNYPPFRYWKSEAVPELLAAQPLNVYLHVPYCVQHCAYCLYKTSLLRDNPRAEVERYVAALCREIELASRHFGLRNRPVTTVYFGGGTPSVLTEQGFERIRAALNDHLTLVDPELTVEAEPVTLTEKKAGVIRSFGANRISLGIQSFRDEIVSRTGRRDTESQMLRAIEFARATGAMINIDLLSGLEGETPETWAYSIDRALATGVDSITVYKMELYSNTAYYEAVRKNQLTLPSDEEEVELMRFAMERFESAGYGPVTTFIFGKSKEASVRHLLNKWRGQDIYAFGVSAFGSLGTFAFQNTSDTDRYLAQIESGELPIARGHRLSTLESLIRDVVLGMKLVRLDLADFRRRHGVDLARLCQPALDDLEQRGFVTLTNDAITLTSEGILFGDIVGNQLAADLAQLARPA